MVGTNSRQCEKLQRHCGKRYALPSLARTILSAAGGEPTIQPSLTGSVSRGSDAGAAGDCANAAVVDVSNNAGNAVRRIIRGDSGSEVGYSRPALRASLQVSAR